jgi:hypothetical protein
MLRKGSKIYSLEAITSDPLCTPNTVLFAALIALGIPPEIGLCGEYVEQVNGRPRSTTVWRLSERSICGKFQTADMIKLWKDPDFVRNRPEHPLAYIKAAFENHSRAIDFVKDQGPIAVIRKGDKVGLVSKHTTPQDKTKILAGLNA